MNTEKDNTLEPLEQIKKVNPPPFLYSKIEKRIKEEQTDRVSAKWLVAASVTLIILIASNSFLISSNLKTKNNNGNNIADAFQLTTNNQLYYE